MNDRRRVFVVVGRNGLMGMVGPVGVAFTREQAEIAAKDAEWICDDQKVVECDLYEERA
jgi:hypothetical protein